MTPQQLVSVLNSKIKGQESVINDLVVAFLCSGHVLLEGPPGVAKTFLARNMASSLQLQFSRIQFTPDLLPSDLIGTNVFVNQNFEFKKGPLFTEILLADEINRAPAKTQSALLEAMQERQITSDGETRPLGDQFFVMATQNPLEHEGTYPLPEAQLDRFMLQINIGYPDKAAELELLSAFVESGDFINPIEVNQEVVAAAAQVRDWREAIRTVKIIDDLKKYVLEIIRYTRENPAIEVGASPRASLALLASARASAYLTGRDHVIPDDIKKMAPAVLRHRLRLHATVSLEGRTVDSVIQDCLNTLPVPR
jgi:MoxR-like ATPase